MRALRDAIRNRALFALMLGHFTNDMFAAVLPILYPLAKADWGMTNGRLGLITLAYTAAGSLLQPIFGLVTDKVFRRWMPTVILLWAATFVSLYGFAPNYWVLMGFAALAGIASAAYHPLGASTASLVSDPRNRNSALSLYTVGGTSGYALGPLVAVAVISLFGKQGTAFFIVPALLAVSILWRQMGPVVAQRKSAAASAVTTSGREIAWFDLGRVIFVVMMRSWSFLAILQFIPVWFDSMHFRPVFYGALATTMIVSGVFGTLIGGALADRIGGRTVVAVSQVLCVPAIILFAHFPGPASFLFGFVFGFMSDSSLSVTLGVAQRLLPGRAGVASGVILGLGFITGGIGVPITGLIADHLGFQTALSLLSILCLIAAAVAMSLERRLFLAEPFAHESPVIAGATAD